MFFFVRFDAVFTHTGRIPLESNMIIFMTIIASHLPWLTRYSRLLLLVVILLQQLRFMYNIYFCTQFYFLYIWFYWKCPRLFIYVCKKNVRRWFEMLWNLVSYIMYAYFYNFLLLLSFQQAITGKVAVGHFFLLLFVLLKGYSGTRIQDSLMINRVKSGISVTQTYFLQVHKKVINVNIMTRNYFIGSSCDHLANK